MDIYEFLKILAPKMGLPSLELEYERFCELEMAERWRMMLEWQAETRRILIYCQLGEASPYSLKKLGGKLLRSNLDSAVNGGSFLAFDDRTEEIVLCYSASLDDLLFESFWKDFVKFIEAIKYWTNQLEKLLEEDASKDEPSGAPEQAPTAKSRDSELNPLLNANDGGSIRI